MLTNPGALPVHVRWFRAQKLTEAIWGKVKKLDREEHWELVAPMNFMNQTRYISRRMDWEPINWQFLVVAKLVSFFSFKIAGSKHADELELTVDPT